MSANLGLIPGTGQIWPTAAANDIALYTTGTTTAWIGASNSSSISVSAQQGTVISGNTTLSNLNITGIVTGLNGISSNQAFSNIYTSNMLSTFVTSSNIFASNATVSSITAYNTSFSNINFTGSLTQNGVPFTSGGDAASTTIMTITGSNATYSNLTVTNSLTLGTNTTNFVTGTANQIYASTWQYMQNYVYAGSATATNIPANTIVMTGVASYHSAFISNGYVYTFGLNANGQCGFNTNQSNVMIPTIVPTISNAIAVSCGNNFTLVLLQSGLVYSMGANLYGQLGNGNTVDQTIPTPVLGLPDNATNPVTAISAGANHSMFLCSNATVYGYGNNTNGQLGNGVPNAVNSTPVTVSVPFPTGPTGSNVRFIDAGLNHSALLLNNGTVYTCGQNINGQLGLGTTTQTNIPTFVNSTYNSNIVSIACGGAHNIMVNAAGAVYSFGNNSTGQLGTGSLVPSQCNYAIPTLLTASGAANAGYSNYISAGLNHSLVVNHVGQTFGFGDNSYGQIGQGPNIANSPTPTPILMSYSVYTAYSVACGANTSILLLNNDVTVASKNRIVAFGQNNYGQVGNMMYSPTGIAASSNVYSPVPLTTNTTTYRKQLPVSSGNSGTNVMPAFYIDVDGTVYAWGYNGTAAIGDGSGTNRLVPFPMSSFNFQRNGTRIVQIASTVYSTLFLDSTGVVWGSGFAGGNSGLWQAAGSSTNLNTPANISATSALSSRIIVSVCSLFNGSLVLDSQGYVWAWGQNGSGQIGNSSSADVTKPINISLISALSNKNIVAIAGGSYTSFALDSTGALWGWGVNGSSELGLGNTLQTYIPTNISAKCALSNKVITTISAGDAHALAIDSTGAVWGFGANGNSQLGNSSGNNPSAPFNISAQSALSNKTVVSIATGYYSSAALDSTGAMWAWGYNVYGQIGNNTLTNVTRPLNISAQQGAFSNKQIIAISVNGATTSYALDISGGIWAWGRGNSGAIGNSSVADVTFPQLISMNSRTISPPMFSQGGLGNHKLLMGRTIVTLAKTIIQAVGDNRYGQLGDSTTTNRSTITSIPAFPNNVVSCATGLWHSACVLSTGVPYLWGLNTAGQCGQIQTTANVITPFSFGAQIQTASIVACGSNTTFFVMQDGSVQAIGDNTNNGLGVPYTSVATNTYSKVLLQFPTPAPTITQVVAGTQAGMALSSTGQIYTWGNNSNGATGQGTFTGTTASPTLIPQNTFIGGAAVTSIAMGDGISAVVAGGNVYTCGLNTEGALGIASNFGTGAINTFTYVNTLSNITNQALTVACGQRHTVVQLANNTVRVFGKATAYQNTPNSGSSFLYGASNTYNPVNLYVAPNLTATAISASANSSLIERFDQTTQVYGQQFTAQTKLIGTTWGGLTAALINPAGKMFMWGLNYNNQSIGCGNATPSVLTPYNISANSTLSTKTIVSAAMTYFNTIAVDSTGAIWTWGVNSTSSVFLYGSSALSASSFPINISSSFSGRNIISVSAGYYHVMALDSIGSVWAWGRNDYGQIGNSSITHQFAPINISAISSLSTRNIVSIVSGQEFSMAIDSQGYVWAWGYNNSSQIGNSSTTKQLTPINVSAMSNLSTRTINAIACGQEHVLALDSTGSLWAWGLNSNAQLGNSSTAPQATPLNISALNPSIVNRVFVAVACGNIHSFAIDSTGVLWGWGYNGFGQLGLGTTTSHWTPQINCFSSQSTGIVAITGGEYFSIVLSSSGQVFSAGNNGNGQLGNGTTSGTAASTIFAITNNGNLSAALVAPVAPTAFTPFFVNFTGQHRVFIAGATTNDQGIEEGFIVVCDQDDYITQGPDNTNPYGKFVRGKNAVTINDALPVVSLAKQAYDKRVFGVLSSTQYLHGQNDLPLNISQKQRLVESGDVRMEVNALGDGAIWVSDINGPLVAGDLITSSQIPGYGQFQSTDDMFHSYTVAKITCKCDFTAPLRPVYKVQTDVNGLNIIDPATGHPVWIIDTTAELQDPNNNNTTVTPAQLQNMTPDQIADLVTVDVPLTEPSYNMRYLLGSGAQISKEIYDEMLANHAADNTQPKPYRAAFVGCTYHSG